MEMEQRKASDSVKGVRKYERRIKELTYQVISLIIKVKFASSNNSKK